MNTRLRTLMYVITVYLLVMGVLFLFLPRTAESAFGISLPDAALTMLYGQVVLTMAYLAYRIAIDITAFGKLYAVFVFLFGGHILVWLYQIFTGVSTLAQVGPPLIISVVFTVLLFLFRGK
jgi:hypothetical protein